MKKSRLFKSIVCMLLAVLMTFSICGCNSNQKVNISDEVVSLAEDTSNLVDKGIDIATDEIINENIDESKLENDGTVRQENISYNGDITDKGSSLLGSCTGLTYYSQIDSRWRNVMYSNHGDKSQTIGSSGCGPTSAAMIVSSSKGAILPTTMAEIAQSNGYRTKNNGTAWSFWSFVADYFGFDFYDETYNFSTVEKYLETDKNKDGISDYFVVVSVGSGLFTTGGHYIVIVGDDDNTLKIYDPYLYNGKFNTASRKAANVKISGNTAYVTESAFKKYANAQKYWIFSNDNQIKSNQDVSNTTKVNYIRYVSTQSQDLSVRANPNSDSQVITYISKGTKVTVDKINGNWSHIVSPAGWVNSTYLSSIPVETKPIIEKYQTNINGLYRLYNNTILYSNPNLTGTKYDYKAKTQIKVVQHISVSVDYIYVVQTGRYAYCNVSAYSSPTSTKSESTINYKTVIGSLYRLNNDTTLYSNSNLTGTKYQYKSQTQIKVLKHISENVDYVYVIKTGRYAYCKVSAYTNSVSIESKPITSYKTTIGSLYRLKTDSILYSKGNLSGTKYQYKALTQVKIIKHYSETVDYVYVVKTGRYAYLKVSNLK